MPEDVRARRRKAVGPAEALLERVERAGADVAVDDAQRAERRASPGPGRLAAPLPDRTPQRACGSGGRRSARRARIRIDQDDGGRADAPAADGVDDEQLEVGEVEREQDPAAGQCREERGRPARSVEAGPERDQRQHQKNRVAHEADERDLDAQEPAPLAGLDGLTSAGAAGERADPADLVEVQVG